MFERFTPRARGAIVGAQDLARHLRHNYIGTEHLLLALLREHGIDVEILGDNSASVDQIRDQILENIGTGAVGVAGHIPFTPRAKKTLELSLREALQLGHNYISPNHLLLGLLREKEGMAGRVLTQWGIQHDEVCKKVGALSLSNTPLPPGVDTPDRKLDIIIMLLDDIRSMLQKQVENPPDGGAD